MKNPTPNSRPKTLNTWAERKGSITGDATGDGEGYVMAINLSVLIIVMGCLVVFSNKFLAVMCTSLWWYLLPSLLKKYKESRVAAAGINSGRSDPKDPRGKKLNRSPSEVNAAIHSGEYGKKERNNAGKHD